MQSTGPQKHQPTDRCRPLPGFTGSALLPREEEVLCGQVSDTSLRCRGGICSRGGHGRGKREACGGDAPDPGLHAALPREHGEGTGYLSLGAPHSVAQGAWGGDGLPISSCPGYFPLTLCRNVFLSWSSSAVPGQDRVAPGPVQPLQSFRQPFLRVACGRTERLGSESRPAWGEE